LSGGGSFSRAALQRLRSGVATAGRGAGDDTVVQPAVWSPVVARGRARRGVCIGVGATGGVRAGADVGAASAAPSPVRAEDSGVAASAGVVSSVVAAAADLAVEPSGVGAVAVSVEVDSAGVSAGAVAAGASATGSWPLVCGMGDVDRDRERRRRSVRCLPKFETFKTPLRRPGILFHIPIEYATICLCR
jgi:hypothetical protein